MVRSRSPISLNWTKVSQPEQMKKGDLSKFVEGAVRWRMLDRTAQAVKDRNQDISAEMMEAMIDEAVRDVRTEIK